MPRPKEEDEEGMERDCLDEALDGAILLALLAYLLLLPRLLFGQFWQDEQGQHEDEGMMAKVCLDGAHTVGLSSPSSLTALCTVLGNGDRNGGGHNGNRLDKASAH